MVLMSLSFQAGGLIVLGGHTPFLLLHNTSFLGLMDMHQSICDVLLHSPASLGSDLTLLCQFILLSPDSLTLSCGTV